MEFKINPPIGVANGSPVDLAKAFNQSRDAYAELQRPIMLQMFLVTHNLTDYFVKFQAYHRGWNDYSPELRREYSKAILQSPVKCDPKLGIKTTEVVPLLQCGGQMGIVYSQDLWTTPQSQEIDFRKMQPIANLIEFALHDSMTKQFNYQVILYSMGFNPRQLIEEQRALEAAAKEVVVNAK